MDSMTIVTISMGAIMKSNWWVHCCILLQFPYLIIKKQGPACDVSQRSDGCGCIKNNQPDSSAIVSSFLSRDGDFGLNLVHDLQKGERWGYFQSLTKEEKN
jgi:hypothetical protein